jgi:hypothetical protein
VPATAPLEETATAAQKSLLHHIEQRCVEMQQVASWSVTVVLSMERIDEDVPCEVGGMGLLYARSRSYLARTVMRGHARGSSGAT